LSNEINKTNEIVTETLRFQLSNQKMIVTDVKESWREEINLKYVAHVRCQSMHSDYRLIGASMVVLGLLIMAVLSQDRMFGDAALAAGVMMIIVGAILVLIKSDKSTLKITLTGVSSPITYQLDKVTALQIQKFVSNMIQMD